MELLKNLNEAEVTQMQDAIAYITILVAGADDKIEAKEIAAAEKLTQIRSFKYHDEMKPYYEAVNATLTTRINELLDALPTEVNARQEAVSGELEKLNPILAKMDLHRGHVFYQTFISFAKHVANSAGGFIGFVKINAEEKKVIDLPMITPIAK